MVFFIFIQILIEHYVAKSGNSDQGLGFDCCKVHWGLPVGFLLLNLFTPAHKVNKWLRFLYLMCSVLCNVES